MQLKEPTIIVCKMLLRGIAMKKLYGLVAAILFASLLIIPSAKADLFTCEDCGTNTMVNY